MDVYMMKATHEHHLSQTWVETITTTKTMASVRSSVIRFWWATHHIKEDILNYHTLTIYFSNFIWGLNTGILLHWLVLCTHVNGYQRWTTILQIKKVSTSKSVKLRNNMLHVKYLYVKENKATPKAKKRNTQINSMLEYFPQVLQVKRILFLQYKQKLVQRTRLTK